MSFRNRNLQIKVTEDFYDEISAIADYYNMPVSLLGSFALRQWLDAHYQSVGQNVVLLDLIKEFHQKKVDENSVK